MNTSLLHEALSHLSSAGVPTEAVETSDSESDGRSDLRLRVLTPSGPVCYTVDVKEQITQAFASTVLAPSQGHPVLVVTRYVPESVAEQWRARGVHFVDAAGNMYLRDAGLLMDVRGRHAPAPRPTGGDRPLRALQPRGLAVVFTLLSQPQLARAPYRELAHLSRASLGTVQWVMTELAALGHLQPTQEGRQLHRTRDLFRRWTEAYALTLRPRLRLALLDAPDPAWWTTAHSTLRRENAQWGDETAAHLLDPHLRPATTVIYADDVPSRLLVEHRLRKAQGPGDVEIRRRFWDFPTPRSLQERPAPVAPSDAPATPDTAGLLVPTPLIYADLLASGDPRLHDAAQRLRENDDLLQRLHRS